MLFALKKFVSYWIMPLPLCVVGLLTGLALVRFSRRQRLGWTLAVASLAVLLALSNHFVSRALMRPLEIQFPPIAELRDGEPLPAALAECRYVVVLGGGNGFTPRMAAVNQLSRSALGRVVEAARILRRLPDAQLIVSGPSDGQRTAHAVMLARAAMSLGVPEKKIVLVDRALDTEDEANLIAKEIGTARFALVTSAWHMPRAVALFRGRGLEPLPCPADFITHAEDSFSFSHLLIDERALACSTWAIRERVGYAWIWLRGKTTGPQRKASQS